jgi:hypothetical protein
MKFRFGTEGLLLTVALTAIWLGGIVATWKEMAGSITGHPGIEMVVLGPFWLPAVFVAFAIGRRTLSAQLVVTLAILEVTFVMLATLILGHG